MMFARREMFSGVVAAMATLNLKAQSLFVPIDMWENRKLVKIYTTLTDLGTEFIVNGKPVPEIYKAEVYSDGFARLYSFADEAGRIAYEPTTGRIEPYILECWPKIRNTSKAMAHKLAYSTMDVRSTEFLTMRVAHETLEIPAKNGWRRYIVGRTFIYSPSNDVGLVRSEHLKNTIEVLWLPPSSPEYEDGLKALAYTVDPRLGFRGTRWREYEES